MESVGKSVALLRWPDQEIINHKLSDKHIWIILKTIIKINWIIMIIKLIEETLSKNSCTTKGQIWNLWHIKNAMAPINRISNNSMWLDTKLLVSSHWFLWLISDLRYSSNYFDFIWNNDAGSKSHQVMILKINITMANKYKSSVIRPCHKNHTHTFEKHTVHE